MRVVTVLLGKCNNTDCKYIHDPAKVAVCTKFLKGKCEDPNCLLQHKIDADLMPVCWYAGVVNVVCPHNDRGRIVWAADSTEHRRFCPRCWICPIV